MFTTFISRTIQKKESTENKKNTTIFELLLEQSDNKSPTTINEISNIDLVTINSKEIYITKKIDIPTSQIDYIFNLNREQFIYMLALMKNFCDSTNFLENKELFYTRFKIPKRSGGFRDLINPREDLKHLQKTLLDFMQNNLKILPHNSAHGFTKNRDAVTNAYTHINSKFLITMDIKDFFPSITKELLLHSLKNNAILSYSELSSFLQYLTEIATLDNVLPQGSPLSPFLSNIVLHEFDYELIEAMKNNIIPKYTYSRYADDICLSAKKLKDVQQTIDYIKNLLNNISKGQLNIKDSKTKVLKNTTRCYITGVKLNKDNHITFGHEKKTILKHELFNLMIAKEQGTATPEQVKETLGRIAWLHRIEPAYTDYLTNKYLKQFNSTAITLAGHFKPYL